MRSSGLRLMLVLLGAANSAVAQVPVAEAPAEEPAGGRTEPPTASEPSVDAQTSPGAEAPAAASEPAPAPTAAPAPDKTPESAAPNDTPRGEPIGPASEVAPQLTRVDAPPTSVPWIRAHSPLTIDAKLGFLVRPERSPGFDEESHVGAEVGLSLYLDLKKEIAAGLEIERASLGRGAAVNGINTVSVDYTVTSAMLGFRAYPKRTELLDLFVGLQLGVGIQHVSAAGTRGQGALAPAIAYKCGGTDAPAFQIGGGVGARLMIAPRWGITARVNGAGRRLSSEVVGDCAQGVGTATTVSASLALGYDFDLDPER